MDPDSFDIVAQEGSSRFIVIPKGEGKDSMNAQIVDTRSGKAFPPGRLQTFLGQGYWEEPTADITVDLQGVDNDWWTEYVPQEGNGGNGPRV